MGFLKKIFGDRAAVMQLPAGSLTLDRQGRIITSTVPSAFPRELLQDLGRDVLELLRDARGAQLPFEEVSLHFGSLRITARELRGGVIIFLFPQSASSSMPPLSPP